MLFCQREAAETAIYLAEAAGRHGEPDFRTRLESENRVHNDGLGRVGLKMATGSGKTVVMAMLIAWQVANKAFSPRDVRFASRFLVVTPGITIRDRLRVLLPQDEQNYYEMRGLVPPDLRSTLDTASIVITNYHSFLPRTAKELQGVASNTRKLLRAGRAASAPDPFVETDEQIVDRVLRDLTGRGRGEVVVINDEAHHCYQDKPLDEAIDAETKREAKERNESARVWFRGLRAVAKRVGVKAIYDLSATPFYLGGSGYQEGYIFPWVVSDFSLMDAIESGIVKIPRIPVDDDVDADQPTYLRLWDHIGEKLPKRAGRTVQSDAGWVPPTELEGALRSLYRSYERRFEHWRREMEELGEPPPVFIVVCPNTIVSKLVFDWIGGQEVELPDGEVTVRPGNLALLSNVAEGRWIDRAPTIIVDSAQLESGEALKPDFKAAAAREIEVFKSEFRLRNPGGDVDKLTDEDLLREVMNTVGKRGRLGEQVRCVVSVSMLTEGWDANTVTHILGIRRFGSQLLCEQVVGRGLRRRSYEPNAQDRFEPEYAEVYGVPFAFIPEGPPGPDKPPPRPAIEVRALDERWPLRIEFPKVEGYRVEVPDEAVHFDHEHCPRAARRPGDARHVDPDRRHRRQRRRAGAHRGEGCPHPAGGVRGGGRSVTAQVPRPRRGAQAVAVPGADRRVEALARRAGDVRARHTGGGAAARPAEGPSGGGGVRRRRALPGFTGGAAAADLPALRRAWLHRQTSRFLTRKVVIEADEVARQPRGARRSEGHEHVGGDRRPAISRPTHGSRRT